MRRSEPLETGLGRSPLCPLPFLVFTGRDGASRAHHGIHSFRPRSCVHHQKPESQSEGPSGWKRRSWAASGKETPEVWAKPRAPPRPSAAPQPPSQHASRHNQWGKTFLAKGMVKVISWNGA